VLANRPAIAKLARVDQYLRFEPHRALGARWSELTPTSDLSSGRSLESTGRRAYHALSRSAVGATTAPRVVLSYAGVIARCPRRLSMVV